MAPTQKTDNGTNATEGPQYSIGDAGEVFKLMMSLIPNRLAGRPSLRASSDLPPNGAGLLHAGPPDLPPARIGHAATANAGRVLTEAQAYGRLAWRVVPVWAVNPDGTCKCPRPDCKSPGKHPVDDGWGEAATCDPEVIETRFGGASDYNVGVRLGPSSGIVDIEFDTDEGRQTADRLLGGCRTPTFTSGKSTHRLFRWHDGLPAVNVVKVDGLECRIGADPARAFQSVFPPSRHKSGKSYAWVEGLSHLDVEPAELPDSVVQLILREQERKGAGCGPDSGSGSAEPAAKIKDGEGRHGILFSYVGTLVEAGLEPDAILTDALAKNQKWFDPPKAQADVEQMVRYACTAYDPGSRLFPARLKGTEDPRRSLRTAEGRTDAGNALRFADRYGKIVRYCYDWKYWLAFDGRRWVRDAAIPEKLAKASVWKDLADAKKLGEATEAAAKWAVNCLSVNRLKALLDLAKAELPITVAELNPNPWLFNAMNGTVDLKTGELRPHDPTDYLTTLAPIEYDPAATSEEWDRFVAAVFLGRGDLIACVRRFFGYALTGDVSEDLLMIFWGSGGNGKSTLINAIGDAVGKDYASAAAPELLVKKKNGTHPTELADLYGKRLVVASETAHESRLDEQRVKLLTGRDPVKGRRMHQDFFEFDPTHKLVIVTNPKPSVDHLDAAMTRRLRLVPFDADFRKDPDKGLPGRLRQAREAILAWCVRGCLDWIANRGVGTCPEIEASTTTYFDEQDVIGRFIDETCVVDDGVKVQASAFYESLKQWCRDSGCRWPSVQDNSQYLRERFEKKTVNGVVFYKGVTLRGPSADRPMALGPHSFGPSRPR